MCGTNAAVVSAVCETAGQTHRQVGREGTVCEGSWAMQDMQVGPLRVRVGENLHAILGVGGGTVQGRKHHLGHAMSERRCRDR